ncbi:MAG TPA: hypothetical protein VIU62_07345, partial [Chloroflexota bacterium]
DGLAGRATSTSSAEADSHGDAVSAVAHTPPPVGENHGQQVSSIARGITTRTVTATSTPGAEQHGVAVSAVAHSTSPTSENHGQQVSSVARGVTTTTSTPVAAANEAAQGGKGNGAGTPPANGQGGSDKSHGR